MVRGPGTVIGADSQVPIFRGIHSLLFDGTEQTTGAPNSPTFAYPSFPGLCITPAGSWLMAYRRAQGHGIQSPPTSSIRLSRSENQGYSWQDRMTETVVVPRSIFYDPYTPSLTTLSDGRIALKYEIDWVSAQPDFAQSFDESAGTFVNELTDFNDTGSGGDIVLFPATEAIGDAFIVGKSERFTSIIWENDAATQGVGGTVAWEYFDGTTWQAVPGLVDDTVGFTVAPSLTLEHVVRWTMPADWAATTLDGSASLFFVRARVTQVYTTNPTMSFGYLRAGPFHDGLFLERTVHVAFSADDGLTFDLANAVEIPRPVVTPGLRYTSAGGAIVELPNGDLISPDYYRQQAGQIRYTSYCSRSTDLGLTWAYLSIMAQHPSESSSGNDGGFQFEEPCIAVLDDGTLLGLVRVDDTTYPIGGGDGTDSGTIFVVTSPDGAVWSPYEVAFQGDGLPAVLQMTNGIVVATSRSAVSGESEPLLWISADRGAPGSWEGPHRYGLGQSDFDVHRYMYAQIQEHPDKPNVACIGYGQEVSLNNGDRIAYLEIGIDADPQLPAYRPTRSAKWGNLNNSFVTYGPTTVFNGVSQFTASIRLRWNSTSGGTQHLFAISGGSSSDRVLRAYFDGGVLWVSVSTGVGEQHYSWNAFTPFDVNAHLYLVYDSALAAASRVRVFRDGVELPPSSTGTAPLVLNTPVTQRGFCLGAGLVAGAGGNLRDMYLADMAFWVGAAHPTAAAEIMNRHVAFDLATSSIALPTIWVPMNGNFVDSRGVLTSPTIVGSDITWDRTWTFGPGYLSA